MSNRVGQQLGNYHLIKLLGQGGFAQVYLGEHVYLGTQAAIKVLQAQLTREDIEQFRSEARTIAGLDHPHIVRVLEFGVDGTTPFLVMSYAPYGTLRTRHPKGTCLSLSTVVSYVKQIAPALQYAHEQKLIHRDIKPENLLLGRHNEVLLSDFGIALIAQTSRYQSTQEVAGTAAYMAPEQLQGKPRRASDQYALGVVVYEWLTGDRPFHGSFSEIASQHLFVPPSPLHEKNPAILPQVERVVLTALEKDPQKRFGSVQDFATALEQASQITAKPPTPTPTPKPAISRGRIILLIGLALIVALASVGLVFVERGNQSAPGTATATSRANANNTVSVTTTQTNTVSVTTTQTNTADASTAQALYNQATAGNPGLQDRLSGQDASTWDDYTQVGYSCTFTGGAYHVTLQQTNYANLCFAHATHFSNFAFQVQMTIIKGDAGGLIFRADTSGSKMYRFSVDQDGDYDLISTDAGNNVGRLTGLEFSSAIKTGLNQANILTVIARGNHIYLYINGQYVNSAIDSSLSSGEIGLFAYDHGNPTEVVYSNAKVWTL